MFFSSHTIVACWMRLFIFLLILVASPSWASVIPQFMLSDDIESQGLSTLHWADTSKVATPAEAKAALMSGELIVQHFIFPSEDTSDWFAVTLKNPTDQVINPNIYITQTSPSIVNLHYQQPALNLPQTKWISLLSGTDIPIKQRPLKALSPAFNLSLEPHQEQTYYLEVHRTIKLDRIDIKIEGLGNSVHFDRAHIAIVTMFISASLVLSIISILMFFSFRDNIYFYYSTYILSFLLTVIFSAGLDLVFELPIANRSTLSLSYNFLAISFTLFVGEVLDAKRTMPWFNATLRFSRVVMVILACLTLYDNGFFSYTSFTTLLLSALILGVAVYFSIVGRSSARLLTIGIIVFLVGVAVSNLTTFGVIPSTLISNDAALFGAFIEMVLFSVVLFKRVLVLNSDKHTANLALLHVAQKSKAVLAKTVHERTLALQQANRAKAQFISTMSHELRTPLNAIIGLSSVLVADTSEISPTKQTEYLIAINDSGQHLLQIIGDILDIEKLDASERTLENNPFTILEVLDLCYKTFSFTCQSKGISLTIDNQFNEAYPVVGDITVLKQILFNLLSNAIKFTEAGSVSLVAAPQLASESGPTPGIIFTVTDTGKGIKADAIPKLFDLFTQEDDSITRSFGGSGLGLNIAQKLAQLMGGGISCNSIVGQGSIFEVIVYLEQQPGSFEMPDVDHSDTFEVFAVPPLKLLIVDDVPLNLMVAVALLKPKGHIIETAENGHTALEMASNNDYDAILMDVHMPGMDGMETTRQIRNGANKERAAVPIVALSADVDVTQQALFVASGMDATVGKPWELEALEKELKRILKLG
jgi:signal transduction histidine kinase